MLVNVSAGTVERLGADTLKQLLVTALDKAEIIADVNFLSGAEMHEAAEQALREARAGKFDAVMAGGGDGTLRTVAGVLADTGVPFAILPLGTLNHFARDLGIPFDTHGAVAVVAAGNLRSVDVGAMNGEVFLNNSSIGLYPSLVLERERQRRRKNLAKWVAMLAAVGRMLRHLPLFRLTVRVGESAEACPTPLLFIANNEYQLALPAPGRRGRLDGGELTIYVAKAQSRLGFLWLAARAILGIPHPEHDMRIVKGRTADIESHRHRLLVAFDGEVELHHPPLHYRIRPGALRVFAPSQTTR